MHLHLQQPPGSFRTIVLGTALALLTATQALAHSPQLDKEQPSDAGRAVAQQAQGLTLALLDASGQLAASSPGARGQALANLLAAARNRHDAMVALLASDPAEAYNVTLPAALRGQLPAEAAPFVEQETTEEGDIEVAHVDYEDPSLDHYEYALNTARGRLSVHFVNEAPDVVTGSRVRIHGLRIDSALLAVSTDDNVVVTAKAAALPNTLGAQKTLTILVNYTTNPVQPFTIASAQSMMFGTVSNYWYENSYQQTTLTGDVAGWFTIVPSSTTCDYAYVESKAKSAAQAAGYNLANYSRFLYIMPSSGCGWAGLSYVGGTPSRSWVISGYFRLSTIAHELGHALGLYHSHSLDCGTASIAASGCTKSEYGDVFDVMGTASTHYNAYQKERLGWLNAGVSPPIATLSGTGSANYTISPLEKTRDGSPRALKIPRVASCGTASDYFYVESRQAIGFDSGLASNASLMHGVLMHDASSADTSYLLDMTPATAAWADAALGAGVTFTDPGSGVTITPVSVGTSASTINVTYPPAACTHAAPTITLTPSGTEYTSAGATATFTATVKNNDPCGCPSAPFNVNASVPMGWSANNPQTASLAPGASGTATLGITTSGSASAAFYTITSTAANANATAYSASATASVAVMAGLAVGSSSDKTTYVRPSRGNQTVNAIITTTVTSGSLPVSGVAVSVKVRDPKGNTSTLSATTGSNGVAVTSYTIKGKSMAGNYSVTASATMGSMTNTATFGFAVR